MAITVPTSAPSALFSSTTSVCALTVGAVLVTVMAMLSTSDCAPPAPLLPRSLVLTCTLVPPWKPGAGVNTMPSSAALIAALVPVSVIALVPSAPGPMARPAVVAKVKVPLPPPTTKST